MASVASDAAGIDVMRGSVERFGARVMNRAQQAARNRAKAQAERIAAGVIAQHAGVQSSPDSASQESGDAGFRISIRLRARNLARRWLSDPWFASEVKD